MAGFFIVVLVVVLLPLVVVLVVPPPVLGDFGGGVGVGAGVGAGVGVGAGADGQAAVVADLTGLAGPVWPPAVAVTYTVYAVPHEPLIVHEVPEVVLRA